MDPVTVKFAQLIGAELLGAALVIGGLVLAFRALAGKSHWILELPGITAKLTNASPGAVVAIIGLAMVFVSLNSSVVRIEETITKAPQSQPVPQPNPSSAPKSPTAQPPSADQSWDTPRTPPKETTPNPWDPTTPSETKTRTKTEVYLQNDPFTMFGKMSPMPTWSDTPHANGSEPLTQKSPY